MTSRTRRLVALLMTILLIGVVTACNAGPAAAPQATAIPTGSSEGNSEPAGGATQSNEGGGVTVEVTLQPAEDATVFEVVMNTHSVDLDEYDLAGMTVLRTDDGTELTPSTWDAPAGGHHRSGTLSFPATDSSTLELVIRNVAEVPERVFRWTR